MEDQNKSIEPLSDSLESEEAAGDFWDSHSTMDYSQYLEPCDDTIEVTERAI